MSGKGALTGGMGTSSRERRESIPGGSDENVLFSTVPERRPHPSGQSSPAPSSGRTAHHRHLPRALRLSSTRLAAIYVALFAVGISAVLASAYFLTLGVLDQQIDAVIRTELEGLADEFNEGGLAQLADVLRTRTDS